MVTEQTSAAPAASPTIEEQITELPSSSKEGELLGLSNENDQTRTKFS